MRHIQDLQDARATRPTVLTIGMFEGVHLGHQHLLRHVVSMAKAGGYAPAVLTFYPHPKMVLRGWEPGFYLNTPDEKAELLGQHGIELVITHPFDESVRHLRAREFMSRLKSTLDLVELWVGPDFALGYGREGNPDYLRVLGAELGYGLHVIGTKYELEGQPISSARIRQALADGDVALTAALLGRPYTLSGSVVQGQQRGRTIGVPTANVDVSEECAVPARGVYANWVQTPAGRYPAVTNIGVRPTFEGAAPRRTIETHLLDFPPDGDLYGQTLTLEFVQRLRDERRFEGIEQLVAQIQRDIAAGRELLGKEGAGERG